MERQNRWLVRRQQLGINEGAADYYANLKCLRNFYEHDDNKTIIAQAKADQRLDVFAEKLCIQQFNTELDQLICMRNSLGGTSVAGLFQDLRKETTPPDYSKPDTRRVTKTDDKHPATQCRMDTYLAGSVCPVDKTVKLSNSDYRQGLLRRRFVQRWLPPHVAGLHRKSNHSTRGRLR